MIESLNCFLLGICVNIQRYLVCVESWEGSPDASLFERQKRRERDIETEERERREEKRKFWKQRAVPPAKSLFLSSI